MSIIESLSVSGHPLKTTKPESSGQSSSVSLIPSPSVSGQPLNSHTPANSLHSSFLLETLSLSSSFGCLLKSQNLTPAYTLAPRISLSFPGAKSGLISAKPKTNGPNLNPKPVLKP